MYVLQTLIKMPCKEHDKEVRACLSGSVHLVSINKYLLASDMFGGLRSRTIHPRDTDLTLQRDRILKRKPRTRRIIPERQGGCASHERCSWLFTMEMYTQINAFVN